MDDDFISPELAKWLKGRGCEIESGVCLLLDCNELCAQEYLGDYKIGVDAMLAYSWYDILVTHAKEFWGEDGSASSICNGCYGRFHTTEVLSLLQDGKFLEAEAYVRKYSLFANS